jgi:catechol 2,3-dioxygenase-like lactoylglutathione lyase family enzyme
VTPHTRLLSSAVQIHHLALRVADCARSLRFYSGVLGLAQIAGREGGGAVWLRAGGAILMLEDSLRGSGPDAGSGHVLAFEIDDVAAWERRFAAAGIVIADRTDHTLYVQDPDGHRVGLSAFPRPS